MNKHIELVKKWLADPESVTQQELEAAADAANDADAYGADATCATCAANWAAHWVKRHEGINQMLNHLIEEDAPSKMELAITHHWDELNGRGITIFSDDEETRVIDMDVITQDCLNDFRLIGLYEATNEGLPFIEALRVKIRTMKDDLMETALEDFYS